MDKYIKVFLTSCFVFILQASGEENSEKNEGGRPLAFKFEPVQDTTAPSVFFPEIQKRARLIDEKLTEGLKTIVVPTNETVFGVIPTAEIDEFGNYVFTTVDSRFRESGLDELIGQFRYFESVLGNVNERNLTQLPVFYAERLFAEKQYGRNGYLVDGAGNLTDPSGGVVDEEGNPVLDEQGQQKRGGEPTIGPRLDYYFARPGDAEPTKSIYEAENHELAFVSGATVKKGDTFEVITSLQDAIYPYQRNLNSFLAAEAQMKLQEIVDEWDAYFENGRPQTFLDIIATTIMEKNHLRKQDYIVGPPPRQWIFLHPSAVIEDVDASPDGDQIKAALAIEWVGVNFWKESPLFKIPLGLSVTSLYSDRADVEDVGHGVTLVVDNKYMLGWASHGGDDGFYVSMDLLKFWNNKKQKIETYRSILSD